MKSGIYHVTGTWKGFECFGLYVYDWSGDSSVPGGSFQIGYIEDLEVLNGANDVTDFLTDSAKNAICEFLEEIARQENL
jgi:hypothetical protein